jgi:uncharacterized protein YacL
MLACLPLALGSAVSCFHILYVTKFETLFSLDPEEVGKRTFFILAIVICLPNAIVGIYSTFKGIHVAKDVTILTQTDYNGPDIQFIPIHTACWTFVFFISSFVAFIFTPIFFYYVQTSTRQLIQPQRSSISLKRYLIGSFGLFCIIVIFLIVTEQSENRNLPISTHIFFIAIDVLLAYHLTEIEARRAAKKYLFYLFNIQESGTRMASLVRHMHGANSHILQPPGVDSTLFTISTRRIETGTSTSHVDIIDL